MRRSLILNILCPSGRNILMCFIVLMIVVATLITFLLFDDITASSISIIYHIHSDIPHDWMSAILYKNYSNPRSKKDAPNLMEPPVLPREFSWLSVFENDKNEIFINGKSFSQIMHDRLRPSLANLLPQNAINDTLPLDAYQNENENEDDADADADEDDNINKHLEWYSSKPIPHLLENTLTINKHETVSTKLIYHPRLQHFILLVITQSRNTDQWTLDIFERDAKPFLWRYAFDTKHLYKDKNSETEETQEGNPPRNEWDEWLESLRNFDIWKSFELAMDLIVNELKTVGVDISLGFDNLNELRHILQEIIVKESTENPSFETDDVAQNNIEKYIGKKTEFYKSYYDVHADKIKIVYTDWHHTERVELNGVFTDEASVFKWSANYQYLLIHSYVREEESNRQRSQLHLFEFEAADLHYNDSIDKLKENDLKKKRKRKRKDDLLEKLQDYGYYKSSALNEIYRIKSHQSTTKHVSNATKFAKMTALAFTPCAIYYALQNDDKLIHCVEMNDVFDMNDGDNMHCANTAAAPVPYTAHHPFEDNESFYEHEDSVIEITKQLRPWRGVIGSDVSDMMVLNASTLLITQQIEHNSYYKSYSTSLLHIPWRYHEATEGGECSAMATAHHDRWYVLNSRPLYRDKLPSNQYYYRHDMDSVHKTLNERRNEHKFDRFGSLIPSIHYNYASPMIGVKEQQRKKENKLHFEPFLFLSNTQNDASSIISATPYFISINHELYDFDDTVEIVNLKWMTAFTHSALNKKGDLLAILDNTDSILVLKKKQTMKEKVRELQMMESINNESVVEILSQLMKENESSKEDVEWKVAVEFTPTSIMSHLKPIDIMCISLDDAEDDDAIDGYVVVLFENGVIASYIIQKGTDTQYHSGHSGSAALLPNGAIDFWLGTCIDWIELMFLMSFAAYFVCSCCRRSSLRIGLGRERVMNANAPNIDAAQAQPQPQPQPQRPRRGALDVVNNEPLQPIHNNRAPLVLNDVDVDDNEEDEKSNGGSEEQDANQRAIQAAMRRFLSQNRDEDEEKNERTTINVNGNDAEAVVRIFESFNNNNNNSNGVLPSLAVNGANNNNQNDDDLSPLSSLSPAINPATGISD